MKLLKKLLPIASVATIGATIAPMVASCGTFNVDLLKYKAKFEPIAADTYDIAKANSELLKTEKIDVLKDDALLTIQNQGSSSGCKICNFKGYVNNFAVEKITKDAADYYMVSYSYGYTVTTEEISYTNLTKTNEEHEMRVDVKNIPVTFTPTDHFQTYGLYGNWIMTYYNNGNLDKTLLTSLNQNWSISINKKDKETVLKYSNPSFSEVVSKDVENDVRKYEYNKDYAKDVAQQFLAQFICLRSFYFDNITIPE